MDHALTRIYRDFGMQAERMGGLLDDMLEMSGLVPQITGLRTEVENLITHLPTGILISLWDHKQEVHGPWRFA